MENVIWLTDVRHSSSKLILSLSYIIMKEFCYFASSTIDIDSLEGGKDWVRLFVYEFVDSYFNLFLKYRLSKEMSEVCFVGGEPTVECFYSYKRTEEKEEPQVTLLFFLFLFIPLFVWTFLWLFFSSIMFSSILFNFEKSFVQKRFVNVFALLCFLFYYVQKTKRKLEDVENCIVSFKRRETEQIATKTVHTQRLRTMTFCWQWQPFLFHHHTFNVLFIFWMILWV